MKTHLLLKRLLFLWLFAFSASVWGQYNGTGTFTKITALVDLTDGYYVVANSGDSFAMNNTNAGSFFTNTSVTPSANTLTNPSVNIVWKIEVNGLGRTIYNEASTKYVSYTGTGNAAQAVSTVSNSEKWTITYSTSTFKAANLTSTTRVLKYNSASPRFACYTAGQQDLQLYKLAAPTGPTVTTTSATSLTTIGATLNGTINANGVSTDASFEYGTTTGYGSIGSASPATVTGSTSTAITGAISSLGVNTQYNYRAVGTVSAVATNGTNSSFWTLANTPSIVTVNNAKLTSLDVTLGSDGNPSATEYAIQESGGNYVQASGSLGATAVWQTSATWGTKTVTGLTAATQYTFQAKARNGANVETAFGGTSSGTTLTPEKVDYNVVQYPKTEQSPNEGSIYTVYVQAYEPSVTTNTAASIRINAWVGYSSTNDNPANAGWTWIAASFNLQNGSSNNTEYKADLPTNVPGTYYYAARFEMDNSGVYTYGGSGGNWNNDNVKLNVLADVVDYANIQSPATASVFVGNTATVYAQVYEPGITNSGGQGTGITAEIGYSSTNTTPDGTWTWLPASYNVDAGNNDEYKADLGSGLTAGTYYYASRFIKSGKSKYIYGGTNGIWNNDSGVLTVNTLGTPTATAGSVIAPESFTANWNAVAGADSYLLDVYKMVGSAVPTNIVGWNFEDSNATADSGTEDNNARFISTNATGLSYAAVSSSDGLAATTTGGWSSGSGSKYWQTTFSTTDVVGNLKFSSVQRSSNTGPSDFKVQFSLNGTSWTDVSGGVVTIGNDWTTGVLTNVSLPALCENQSLVYLRWIMTSNNAVNGSAVAGGGTSAIDNISVTGDLGGAIKVFALQNMNVGNVTSYSVTGLDPQTTYNYLVRAKSGVSISENSNEIQVITLATPVTTWDGSSWSNGAPDGVSEAIINGNYAIATSIDAKILTVKSGFTLTVPSTGYVKAVTVNNNGKILVADNGNFVQTGTFTPAGSGSSFKVVRNTTPVQRLDYNSWSSPMATTDQTLKLFSPLTTDVRFLSYNNGLFAAIPSPSTVKFMPGQGYLIRTPNNYTTTPQVWTGTFEGTVPNSGTVTYSPTGITGQYVFLGNPYPSAISMADFATTNSAQMASGTFYIWNSQSKMDGNGDYSGNNYITHTSAGSVPAGSPFYVPVGQGFFVDRGNNTGDFTFNNQMRRTADTGTFAKTSVSDKFWLQMTTPSASKPQLLIGFTPSATSGYDAGLDGKMFDNTADAIYSTVDNQTLIINALGTFNSNDLVNVTSNFTTAGTYTISIAQKEGMFDNGQQIYLKDNVTGISTELTAGNYTFTANPGISTDRFTISFVQPVLVTSEVATNQFTIYVADQIIHIKSSKKIASLELYEMSGKLLKTQGNINSQTASIPVTFKGIAIVKMVLEKGEVVTKKIIIK